MLCVGASLLFSTISEGSNPNLFLTPSNCHKQQRHLLQLKHSKCQIVKSSNTSYEVGGGYSVDELNRNSHSKDSTDTCAQREALLKGGDQVISVLQEIITLLEDMDMDEESEKVAVELATQGVIGKRVDQMESDFMMALDYMIHLADNDQDDKRKSLLEVIKETVLSHLTKKCPPHVQVIGLLCRTPKKESRYELLRRVAAGGGVFKGENDLKVHIPGANLNDVANQADDLLEVIYKTLNPQWNQTLEFPDDGSPLVLYVKDHNALLPTSSIGECVVEYQKLPPNQMADKWIPLQGVKRGEIRIQITRKIPEIQKRKSIDSEPSLSKLHQIPNQIKQMMIKFRSLIEDGNLEGLCTTLSELETLEDTQEGYIAQLETEQMLLLSKIKELGQEIINSSPSLSRRHSESVN